MRNVESPHKSIQAESPVSVNEKPQPSLPLVAGAKVGHVVREVGGHPAALIQADCAAGVNRRELGRLALRNVNSRPR